MDKDVVAKWLKKYVGSSNCCDSFWGYYDFANTKMMQNVGAVYGIWMKATKKEIINYARECHKEVVDINKEFQGYIPIYWGKDISPCNRLCAHLKTSKGTGGLNLIKTKYTNKKIVFGCILVKKYYDVEKQLHNDYPVSGKDLAGRKSTKRQILE